MERLLILMWFCAVSDDPRSIPQIGESFQMSPLKWISPLTQAVEHLHCFQFVFV